jgi:hypothetical protein
VSDERTSVPRIGTRIGILHFRACDMKDDGRLEPCGALYGRNAEKVPYS